MQNVRDCFGSTGRIWADEWVVSIHMRRETGDSSSVLLAAAEGVFSADGLLRRDLLIRIRLRLATPSDRGLRVFAMNCDAACQCWD